jgi:hypothetical protein
MKTITTYELLGMIKDGKAPKKIKYNDKIWNYKDGIMEYISEDTYFGLSNFEFDELNEKVEILEEEKKLPEKLYFHDLENITENEKILVCKINSILDYLESKEKGE